MQAEKLRRKSIGHVLNELGTGYEYLKSIELKNGARHLKEHPNISKFAKFESYWLKGRGKGPKSLELVRELSMDWRDACPSNPY